MAVIGLFAQFYGITGSCEALYCTLSLEIEIGNTGPGNITFRQTPGRQGISSRRNGIKETSGVSVWAKNSRENADSGIGCASENSDFAGVKYDF